MNIQFLISHGFVRRDRARNICSQRPHQQAGSSFIVFLALGCLITGCDRADPIVQSSSEDTNNYLVSNSVSPKSTLSEVVRAYKSLSSYQDKAYVELSYNIDGQPYSDTAPMSVAWDNKGRLGLRVYSVKAGPTKQQRWELLLEHAQVDLANQLLSRALPKEMTLDWLLADPLVRESLSAGQGGFPPQLDFLLANTPMAGLVNDRAALAFGQPETVDGRACTVVNVSLGTATYGLVIDQASMLLRRIKLPLHSIPPEIRGNPAINEIRLSIEFDDVLVNAQVPWNEFSVEHPADALLVNHFVPVPPYVDTSRLGRRVPAFTLKGPDGKPVFDGAQTGKKIQATVLYWLADHPTCRVAAKQIHEAKLAIERNPELKGAVQFVPIWAEPTPPTGSSFTNLTVDWELAGSLALDRDALGRDVFQIQQAPTVLVLDSANRIQFREEAVQPFLGQILPKMLSDLCAGIDVAAELRQQNQDTHQRYLSELRAALAVNGSFSKLGADGGPYPPMRLRLEPRHEYTFRSPVVSTCQDASQTTWTLHANGELLRRVAISPGSDETTLMTPWKDKRNSRILVGPEQRFIALIDGPNIELFDAQHQFTQPAKLGPAQIPVDFAWLNLTGTQSPRLAVITDNELVLLDPTNKEQLSGSCPARPIALIQQESASTDLDAMVVLENRAIEPVQLAGSSNGSTVPGRPVSYNSRIGNKASLSFQPARGFWRRWTDVGETAKHVDPGSDRLGGVLGTGWLAKDEPAIFLLDSQFEPIWHYRIPLANKMQNQGVWSARDPVTSLETWVMMDSQQTIRVLRSDGFSDHFRLQQELVGLALTPSGTELLLTAVYPESASVYRLEWR